MTLDRREPPHPAAATAILVAFAVISGWLALSLLARVTPALFPGQQLPLSTELPAPLNPIEIKSPGQESVFNQPIVLLVAGVDTRPDTDTNLAAVNTDTIMLMRLDPVAKDVRVLSVPRDLFTLVTYADGSRGLERINTSFALGASRGGGASAGMNNLRNDLEQDFGIDIDYWVQVDFRGAERLIDALGGLDLDIPGDLAIDGWWYSDDDVHHQKIDLPAGPQHLDGYHAVAFARLRAPDDDLHRIKRQQLVLEAAVKKAFSSGLMNDPVGLWSAYGSAVKTSVPGARLPGYAVLAGQTRGAIETYSLADSVDGAPAVRDVTLPSGAEVLVGVPDAIEHWIDTVFGDEPGKTKSAVVRAGTTAELP